MWVYEIGTSPYFTNVAPGEVPDLPPEATPPSGGTSNARPLVYTDGQQVEYPPYDSEGEQIQVHPVQYQPEQPGNPEVVVVDDTDINVDGEPTKKIHTLIQWKSFIFLIIFFLCCCVFSVFSYNLGTCANNRNKCSQFADCKDYSSGYCCHCRPGFYGNGIQCVAEGDHALLFCFNPGDWLETYLICEKILA